MESDLKGNSLSQLIGYYEHPSAESQLSTLKISYSLSDFNNVETADRKLIINDKLEFWVHDYVLNSYCDYFKMNLVSERPPKNPYIQNKRNSIEIKEFKEYDDESKDLGTEEPDTNCSNTLYSKFILKNTNFKIENARNNNNYNKKENNIKNNNNINNDNNKDLKYKESNLYKKYKDKRNVRENNNSKGKKINQENKEINEFLEALNASKSTIKEEIQITKINLPNKSESELFFEVLLWMYTKDKTKLKKFTKNFEMLLHLLSLGIFLKMKKEYFQVLLSNLKIIWDKKLFSIPLWTRDKFSFHVLEKIVPLISTSYLRIYSLISWLKSIDLDTNKIIKDKEFINKCLCSKDFFLVRNYIKRYKLMHGLSKEELIDLKNNFSEYIDCLDLDGLLNSYLFVPLSCVICKNNFSSVYEVLNNKACNNEKYHPPCGPMDSCQHKGCQKRFKKNEYYCCHKKISEKDSGCLTGEGKHIFVLNNKK